MKNKSLILGLFVLLLLTTSSCDFDPCDEGYTQVTENGATYCLPDYIVGIEKMAEYGNKFYHSEYGIIKLVDGEWSNQFGEVLTNKQVVALEY